MKKLLLALFLMGAFVANAQIFAPPGAEWRHYARSFTFSTSDSATFKYTGDTLINGITCQKVRTMGMPEAYNSNFPETRWNGIYCFYSDANAIYFYNYHFNLFNKIFDYTLPVGDSLLIYEYDGICLSVDSMAYYKITDKGTDIINGESYRWVEYGPSNLGSFSGKFYEKLGFLNGFITVQPDHCAGDGWFVICLASYKDDSDVNPKYFSDACFNLTLSAEENPAPNFSLYPNPIVDGSFSIQSPREIKQVELIDMLGQTVLSTTTINSPINTGNLAAGLYVARVTFANGAVGSKRIVVSY